MYFGCSTTRDTTTGLDINSALLITLQSGEQVAAVGGVTSIDTTLFRIHLS